ncbi:hypothetical protein [Schlesneria sp. DSM 10557]
MKTAEDVDASLAQQVERHRVLKLILAALEKLEQEDEEGAVWVVEQINDE